MYKDVILFIMIKSTYSNSLVMYLQTYLPRQMKRTDLLCVVIFFFFEIDIHYGQKDEPEPFGIIYIFWLNCLKFSLFLTTRNHTVDNLVIYNKSDNFNISFRISKVEDRKNVKAA